MRPQPEQLVFPFVLRVGDVIFDNETPAEVVAPPTAEKSGETTHAWIRHQGKMIQRETVWEGWRKVRVLRRAAA